MAENVNITEGVGTPVGADDISGVKYQKMKLVDGKADATTMIEAGGGIQANALRVTIASDSTGLISIDDNGGAITVDGTITANLGTVDNAVLDAIQAAVEVLDNIVSGSEAQVDVLTVPAPLSVVGGGTEAAAIRVTIANNSTGLISIDDGGNTITIDGTVTANLSATDNAVLDAIQAAVEIIDNSIAGSETQVDVVASLPAGTNNIGDVDIASALPAGTNAIGKLAANSGIDIGDVDVLSIAAGENQLGDVGMPDDVKTITCSLDTNAYADGDVLFDTQEIAGAVRNSGDSCTLQSVHVLDKDDQGIDFELVFFNAATSLGTENAAISIAAADADDIIGHFAFTKDYVDLINSQIRSEGGIGLELKAGAATTSLYVAGISKGAGTYTASGILISFGFLRN